ncbi:MAG: CPBP family intramembrane metalloprotease [Alphaproteobacteria bacterium]|nr:CPBP family intramembrane metalloprotease [Alphaproteobacteria bacterium]
MHQLLHARAYLIAELLLIAVAVPVLFMGHMKGGVLFAVLWVMLLYCIFIYRHLRPDMTIRQFWDGAALRAQGVWKPILVRFVISAIAMTALLFTINPEKFLELPTQRTGLWMMIMVMYPLISVVPQEFIFRTYFFERYKPLFPSRGAMITASALAFGFAHIILQNWVAVGLTTIGGFYFACTYHKRRSMALVWAEHALYGCFLFTIGLGTYFYSGAPNKW